MRSGGAASDDEPEAASVAISGSISGVVVDERGTPVRDFVLAVETFVPAEPWGQLPDSSPRTVRSSSGTFALEQLPFGRYVLSASSRGRSVGGSESLQLSQGAAVATARIALDPAASAVGTVVDAADGAPIPGATVTAERGIFSESAVELTVTDSSGAFVLGGVPAGPLSLRIEARGYRTHLEGCVAGGGSVAMRQFALQRSREGRGAEMVGIGAIVGKLDDEAVLFVIAGGPAEQAGLQSLDRVARIDGQATATLTPAQCTQLLGGAAGTPVTLAVERVAEPGAITEVRVVRETLEL